MLGSSIPPRKKCDPVNRFHQLKSMWGRDSFLQRLEKPNQSKSTAFGGLSYHQWVNNVQ